ncbi:MAG: Gfo/Idh/MocA family protein [Pirellulaceae bacterium]
MATMGRRTFVVGSGTATATWLAQHARVRKAVAQTQSAARNEASRIVVAVIGTGGMGSGHVRALAARADVTVACLCDVDSQRLATAAKAVESASGKRPRQVSDLRKVLDDKSVDAVFIATPDHWHAPAAILALDAGKHVYVEKPCCHNIREGRLMADAVTRSGKLLQVGTQSRSTDVVREGIERLQKGEIGEVIVAKAWNSQRRGSIGKSQPATPPAYLDFDQWVGPAPMVPYRPNLLPAVWRWWYDFGCGDMGNDGVHDIDVACWGLGVTGHPVTVTCAGSKYFFDDDQQFPDTQYAVCEYSEVTGGGRRKQLIFEQRIWSPYTQEGYENGAAFYGTNGLLLLGHTSGWKLYGPRNALIAERSGPVDLPGHHTNFLDCIRGSQKQLNADIRAGMLSAGVVHLSNIAARLGRVLRFDPQREQILDDEAANALVRRQYRDGHWAVPRGV